MLSFTAAYRDDAYAMMYAPNKDEIQSNAYLFLCVISTFGFRVSATLPVRFGRPLEGELRTERSRIEGRCAGRSALEFHFFQNRIWYQKQKSAS